MAAQAAALGDPPAAPEPPAPEKGLVVAFRPCAESGHRHTPHVGPRRVAQVNW